MKTKHLIFLFIYILLLSACKDSVVIDEPINETESNVRYITADIEKATVWSADTIYVIDNDDFYVNASLSIEAGTIIKFQSTKGAYLILGSNGGINATGTFSNPIIFTSFLDDEHGGDTNNDGSASTPNPGDWNYINVNDQNSTKFEYCKFFYGGNGSYGYTLTLYGSKYSIITNCTFAHNIGHKFGDFYYGALDASNAEEATTIENNIFYDNNIPLSVSTKFPLGNSNTFHNPENESEINTMNGIFTYAISEIDVGLSWEETEVAYVINDNDLWISSNNSLALADDVVLKFTAGSELLIDDGALLVQGTNVFFTSFKDDTHKGDTNGDGQVSSPNNGDWEGIFDNSLSIPFPHYYTWSNILYDSY